MVFLSCKKEPAYALTPTDIPANFDIDINQDGITDFVFEYEQLSTSDIPVSGSSVIGSFTPSSDVSILYGTNIGNLFLAPNDTIFDSSTSLRNWYTYRADVISKDWSDDSGWDPTWEVISNQSEHYLAFKLENGTANELGWLKLQFDINTGETVITDQGVSTSSFIVIQ